MGFHSNSVIFTTFSILCGTISRMTKLYKYSHYGSPNQLVLIKLKLFIFDLTILFNTNSQLTCGTTDTIFARYYQLQITTSGNCRQSYLHQSERLCPTSRIFLRILALLFFAVSRSIRFLFTVLL